MTHSKPRPRVFRGFDLIQALSSVSRTALIYGGAFLVLWTLGLVVRGQRGWMLVVAPLVLIIGLRVWAWRRLSVDVADGSLRYEGVSAKDDFEVSLSEIDAVCFDPMLAGRPLVLSLHDGDERILDGLRRARAEELRAHLIASGVREV